MDYKQFCTNVSNLLIYFGNYYNQYLLNPNKHPCPGLKVQPGELFSKLEEFELISSNRSGDFSSVLDMFFTLVYPHMSNWQHVNFLSYFPCGYSYESIIGELLTAMLGINSFSWMSCPASTELEMHVMNQLVDIFKLPIEFKFKLDSCGGGGVVLCSASEAITTVINSIVHNNINVKKISILSSDQAHCCVDKACKLLRVDLIKVTTSDQDMYSMTLENFLRHMHKNVKLVICTLGTTSSCAVDDIASIGEYCSKHKIYLHVDASYMGNMFLIDEFRKSISLKHVNSININLSKWLRVNLDAACLWVKDTGYLTSALHVTGPYISNEEIRLNNSSRVVNYRNWCLSFSRRFRSLKIWFVLKGIGSANLRIGIENQIEIAKKIKRALSNIVEILPQKYDTGLVCFRVCNSCLLTKLVMKLLTQDEFCLFLQTTKLNNKEYIRVCINSNQLTCENCDEYIVNKIIKCIDSLKRIKII